MCAGGMKKVDFFLSLHHSSCPRRANSILTASSQHPHSNTRWTVTESQEKLSKLMKLPRVRKASKYRLRKCKCNSILTTAPSLLREANSPSLFATKRHTETKIHTWDRVNVSKCEWWKKSTQTYKVHLTNKMSSNWAYLCVNKKLFATLGTFYPADACYTLEKRTNKLFTFKREREREMLVVVNL